MVVMTLQRPVKVMDGDPCEANCLCGKFTGGWRHLRGAPDETTGILASSAAEMPSSGSARGGPVAAQGVGLGEGIVFFHPDPTEDFWDKPR